MGDAFSRIEELFAAALDRPQSERLAFVRAACGGDEALAQKVEALLQAHDQAGRFLEEPASAGSPGSSPADDADFDGKIGSRIGRYRLIKRIGEGGGGIVFLAEQEEPVRRRVALKIIKLGMDTREFVARFEAERQALALMDHPGIARVYDAGSTERGRPYFVMELVDGVPITRYCDGARLTAAARLELFGKVCLAIQHAHQKGIIHRDIKPSNILVALQDGVAAPKIIDFGIAKATAGRLTDQTLLTQFAHFVGTPAYMSPEQTIVGSADLDTRSDVYALGVLLYELLSGQTPFDSQELIRAGLDEMRRCIREQEPVRPSRRVDTLAGATRREIALARSTEPPQLVSQLRGDLDWIALRCLEKDPNRRYPTANALAEDVRRYLEHEPVSAASPGRFYLLRKFVRRHRAAVAAGLAFVALLGGAAVVSALLAARATKAERLAQDRLGEETAARNAAEVERSRALAISNFLQNDILEQAGPGYQPDPNLTVRAAVNAAAKRMDGKFANQPEVELALRETLARTFFALDDIPAASEQCDLGLALAHRINPDAPEALSLLQTRCDILRIQGKLDAAANLEREVLAARTRVLGPDSVFTVSSQLRLFSMLVDQGRYAEAEPGLKKLVSDPRRVGAAGSGPALEGESVLAKIYANTGRPSDAEGLWRKVRAGEEKLFSADSPGTLHADDGLADVLRRLGRYSEAEALQRYSVEMWGRHWGPEHRVTLDAEESLIETLLIEGKFSDAANFATQALKIRLRVLGPESRPTLVDMHYLSAADRGLGHLDDAERNAAAALAGARRGLGPAHGYALFLEAYLGAIYVDERKFGPAEAALREALAGQERKAPDSWVAFFDRALLGAAELGQGRFAEAEPLLLSGYAGMKERSAKMPETQKALIAETRARLLQLYTAWGKPAEAARWRPDAP